MGLRVSDPNKDEQEKDQAPGQPVSLGAGESSSTTTAGTGSGQPGSIQARDKSSSGNFTNISSYKAANSQGAQQLGQGLSNKIGGQEQNTRNDINKQQQGFQSGFQQGEDQLKGLQSNVDQTKQNLTAGGDDFNNAYGALSAASKAAYNGPQGLNNVGQLQQSAKNVQDLANATTNSNGRLALLQRFYNSGDYTAGKQNLDNALIGNQNFNGTIKNSRQLGLDVNQQAANAQKQAAGAGQLADSVKQNALATANTAEGGRYQNMLKQVQDFISNENARAAGPISGVDNVNLGADQVGNINFNGVTKDKNGNPIANANGTVGGFGLQLTPEQLRQLGGLNYKANVDTSKGQDQGYIQSLLGGLSQDELDRDNQLRQLTGQDALQKGQDLQQGSFQQDTNKINNDILGNYRTGLQQALSGGKIGAGVVGTANGFSLANDLASGNTAQADAIRQKAIQQALANMLNTNTSVRI